MASVDTSEKGFEVSLEAALLREPLAGARPDVAALADAPAGAYLSGGYRRRELGEYDRALCLISHCLALPAGGTSTPRR
jgi:hypothetical protein